MRKSTAPALFSLVAAIVAIIASLSSCVAGEPLKRTEYVLGTSCSVSFYESGHKEAMEAAFARLREIEDRMSANKEGTEVDRINAQAGIAPQSVSPDTFFVVKTALEYGRITKGALDISVGPLVKLWGIGGATARIPTQDEIDSARALSDYRLVKIDESALSVFLPKKGMRIDLGALAKGYAADEAVRILKEAGVKRAIIDLGGNIYAMGAKKNGDAWRIGIQAPDDPRGAYMGIVSIQDSSLVTSGDYERFFEEGGKRYHHILDAASGYPSDSGLRSVTVVSSSSIKADALSTSMFVLGRKKGLELAASMPEAGFVFVDVSGKVWTTANIKDRFSIQAGPYSPGSE